MNIEPLKIILNLSDDKQKALYFFLTKNYVNNQI